MTYLKQSGYLSEIDGDFDNAIGNSLDNIEAGALNHFLAKQGNRIPLPTEVQLNEDDDSDSEQHDDDEYDQVILALEEEELNRGWKVFELLVCSI